MKIILFVATLLFPILSHGQILPIDFESDVTTSSFTDFDGGTASVIANPQSNGINTSSMVAKIVRDGGAIWAGSKIQLDNNLDFTTMNSISMKVFTTAPIGTVVKFKLEGGAQTERDVVTTKINEWETLTWDFTAEPMLYDYVVFMFDFGNTGNGSESSTFLFDDVEQFFGGFQIDFPVNFEEDDVNYTMTDFGGNLYSFEVDPNDSNNHVVKVIKTDQAATWAGTTIGTNAGFATNLPLALDDSKMTVRVWSPEAGTPIRLKVEDSSDPTHTCETETNTTIGSDWETIEFDFVNQAPGTESLSVGLDKGWTYNMASIFFNFGTDGSVAGEQIYYFDDVQFGEFIVNIEESRINPFTAFPNPTSDYWTIEDPNNLIKQIEVFNFNGQLMTESRSNHSAKEISGESMNPGIYIAKITTNADVSFIKLYKL